MPQVPGRPRTASSSAIVTPLSKFIDDNWRKVGLTNDQAVAQFGLKGPNIISMWRMGKTAVALQHIPTLARLLGVDEMSLVALWFRQQQAREPAIPNALIDRLEIRLTKG